MQMIICFDRLLNIYFNTLHGNIRHDHIMSRDESHPNRQVMNNRECQLHSVNRGIEPTQTELYQASALEATL